jgi:PelA/Pel-15E family pectate lyase
MKPAPLVIGLIAFTLAPSALAAPTEAEVRSALEAATAYASSELSHRGGYLWWYAADGSEQAGEGAPVPETTVWVQPPGTPAVGMAYLRLYDVTGDERYLRLATQAAEALAWGQMVSGGWYAFIDFGEPSHRHLHYLREYEAGDTDTGKRWSLSTLDDDITQSALRLLLEVDDRLSGGHPAIHHALVTGMTALLSAQYPAGAWPQVFDGPVEPRPVLDAAVPDDWRDLPRIKEYWHLYTLNDAALETSVRTLLRAHDLHGDDAFQAAALRGGEFLLRAQLPDPHPVWAQQYDFQMRPAWARKFEMPAASSLESVGVMELLVDLWAETGDERYRDAAARALEWFPGSQLENGQWARFYELNTSQPIYFNREYEVTYDDSDLPTHYGFKFDLTDRLSAIEADLSRSLDELRAERGAGDAPSVSAAEVEAVLDALDDRGRWITMRTEHRGQPVDDPIPVIEMSVYVENLNLLAAYLEGLGQG